MQANKKHFLMNPPVKEKPIVENPPVITEPPYDGPNKEAVHGLHIIIETLLISGYKSDSSEVKTLRLKIAELKKS